VRAALDRLSEDGLLDVRQGRGYLVKDYRRSAGPDLLASLARIATEAGTLQPLVTDLLLVRRQLAVAVLGRIKERQEVLSVEEWGELRSGISAAIDAFAEATSAGADLERLAEADVAVVAALVAAADSAVFSLCMNPLAQTLKNIPRLRAAIYREPESNVVGWRLLGAWLEAPKLVPVDVLLDQLRQRDVAVLTVFGATS